MITMTNQAELPESEVLRLVREDMIAYGSGFMMIDCNGKAQHAPLDKILVKPELPDCRLCCYYTSILMAKCYIKSAFEQCTNGSEFKPAKPIRLYTITTEGNV